MKIFTKFCGVAFVMSLCVSTQASIIFDDLSSQTILRADDALGAYNSSTQSLLSSFSDTLIDGENLNLTSLVANISEYEASFDIDMFHRRSAELTAISFSSGALYFDVDQLTEYSLAGYYTQDGANDFYQYVVLKNISTNQIYFEGGAQDLLGNENYFTLGNINNSDYYSVVTGDLSGSLSAGSYMLEYRYHTQNHPAGAITRLDAAAQGDLHFTLAQAQGPGTVPEPLSLALFGMGSLVFGFFGFKKKSNKA